MIITPSPTHFGARVPHTRFDPCCFNLGLAMIFKEFTLFPVSPIYTQFTSTNIKNFIPKPHKHNNIHRPWRWRRTCDGHIALNSFTHCFDGVSKQSSRLYKTLGSSPHPPYPTHGYTGGEPALWLSLMKTTYYTV